MDIKQQFKDKPLSTISAILGIITGIIGVIGGGTVAVNKASEMLVFKGDLTASENRIIERIRKEAVITRLVIVGELEERKDELLEEMDETDDPGKLARLLEELKVLNKRLDKIRGIDE